MLIYEYLQEAIWDTSQVALQFTEDVTGHVAQVTIPSGTAITFMDGHTVVLSGGAYTIPAPATPQGKFDQWYVHWNITTGEIGIGTRTMGGHWDGWALLATGYHANGDPRTADQVIHITRHAHWHTFVAPAPHYSFLPNGQVTAHYIGKNRHQEVVHPPLV